MPKQPTPDRRVVSVTMRDDLYQRLRSRCAALDKPVTVFVRDAIKQALGDDMET